MNNDTKIRIGLFGDSTMFNQIKGLLKQFPSFDSYFYECHEGNIIEILTQADKKLEVGLIVDYDSYVKVNHSDYNLPLHFLNASVSSLYRILYMNRMDLDAVDVLSIDSLNELSVLNLLKETGFSGEVRMVSSSFHTHETAVSQHLANIAGFQHPFILTSSRHVFSHIKDISKNLIYPTDQDMIVALERALLSSETRRKKEHQAVVGSIHIQKGEPSLLEKFSHLVEGHLIEINPTQYVLTSKRGIFERVTQGYKYLPLISGNDEAVIHMGIGFHASSKQAGAYSKIALEHALAFKKSACYVVREDQSVFGPIAFGTPATYHTIITNREAIKEAKQVGMTAVHMDRLKAFLSRKEAFHFTANDFANVSDITLRSAHRILLNWQDADLVVIAGQEKTRFKGRPKVIYTFK
jgi:hypothetical protein